MERKDVGFIHRCRVRWADLDPQDIVFNPNYFVFFDTAFNDYMHAIGYPLRQGLANDGADMLAVRAEAEFRGSARLDDNLDIGVAAIRLGRSSMEFAFPLWHGDRLLVLGRITYVTVGLQDRRPRPLPSGFVAGIRRLQVAPLPETAGRAAERAEA